MFFDYPQDDELPIRDQSDPYSPPEDTSQDQLVWLSRRDNLSSDARDVLGDFLDLQIKHFGMYEYPPSKEDWETGIKDLIHLQQAVNPGIDLGEFSTTSSYFVERNRNDFTVYDPRTDSLIPPSSRRSSTNYEGGARSRKSRAKKASKKKSKSKKSRSRK